MIVSFNHCFHINVWFLIKHIFYGNLFGSIPVLNVLLRFTIHTQSNYIRVLLTVTFRSLIIGRITKAIFRVTRFIIQIQLWKPQGCIKHVTDTNLQTQISSEIPPIENQRMVEFLTNLKTSSNWSGSLKPWMIPHFPALTAFLHVCLRSVVSPGGLCLALPW